MSTATGPATCFTDPATVGSITTYTRPASTYATLSKDSAAAVELTLTYRDGTADRFDIAASIARLERSVDRHGNAIVLTYGTGNQIDRVSDPAGRDIDFTSDGLGRLTSIQDWAYVDGSGGGVQASAGGSGPGACASSKRRARCSCAEPLSPAEEREWT